MSFGERAMAEWRILGHLRDSQVYFLWVGMGRNCRWSLFIRTLLLVDTVGILPDDLSVNLIVLVEGKLLLMCGWLGVARQEVPRVGCVLPTYGRFDHLSANNFIKQQTHNQT